MTLYNEITYVGVVSVGHRDTLLIRSISYKAYCC